jgi:indole-3-glycerol phosphate synthase
MSSDFLTDMANSSRVRVRVARAALSDERLLALALSTPLPPRLKLSPQGFDIIAEVKLRSPAMGALRDSSEDIGARVRSYADAGAAAISVLTEPQRFDGSLQHLVSAATVLGQHTPAMRKDFLVDPYQVMEARYASAGGVLAILRMLPYDDTVALITMATRLGLFVLLEAFDAADIAVAERLLVAHQAAAIQADAPLLVGVNCRDLVSLQVVPGRLEVLAAQLPRRAPRVAESGLESPADAARLAAAGYNMALVGGALMKSAQPAVLLSDMLATGRGAAARAVVT